MKGQSQNRYFCLKETRLEGGNTRVRPGHEYFPGGNDHFQEANNCVGYIDIGVPRGGDCVRNGDNRFAFRNDPHRLFDNHLGRGNKYLRHGNKYLRDGDKYFARAGPQPVDSWSPGVRRK